MAQPNVPEESFTPLSYTDTMKYISSKPFLVPVTASEIARIEGLHGVEKTLRQKKTKISSILHHFLTLSTRPYDGMDLSRLPKPTNDNKPSPYVGLYHHIDNLAWSNDWLMLLYFLHQMLVQHQFSLFGPEFQGHALVHPYFLQLNVPQDLRDDYVEGLPILIEVIKHIPSIYSFFRQNQDFHEKKAMLVKKEEEKRQDRKKIEEMIKEQAGITKTDDGDRCDDRDDNVAFSTPPLGPTSDENNTETKSLETLKSSTVAASQVDLNDKDVKVEGEKEVNGILQPIKIDPIVIALKKTKPFIGYNDAQLVLTNLSHRKKSLSGLLPYHINGLDGIKSTSDLDTHHSMLILGKDTSIPSGTSLGNRLISKNIKTLFNALSPPLRHLYITSLLEDLYLTAWCGIVMTIPADNAENSRDILDQYLHNYDLTTLLSIALSPQVFTLFPRRISDLPLQVLSSVMRYTKYFPSLYEKLNIPTTISLSFSSLISSKPAPNCPSLSLLTGNSIQSLVTLLKVSTAGLMVYPLYKTMRVEFEQLISIHCSILKFIAYSVWAIHSGTKVESIAPPSSRFFKTTSESAEDYLQWNVKKEMLFSSFVSTQDQPFSPSVSTLTAISSKVLSPPPILTGSSSLLPQHDSIYHISSIPLPVDIIKHNQQDQSSWVNVAIRAVATSFNTLSYRFQSAMIGELLLPIMFPIIKMFCYEPYGYLFLQISSKCGFGITWFLYIFSWVHQNPPLSHYLTKSPLYHYLSTIVWTNDAFRQFIHNQLFFRSTFVNDLDFPLAPSSFNPTTINNLMYMVRSVHHSMLFNYYSFQLGYYPMATLNLQPAALEGYGAMFANAMTRFKHLVDAKKTTWEKIYPEFDGLTSAYPIIDTTAALTYVMNNKHGFQQFHVQDDETFTGLPVFERYRTFIFDVLILLLDYVYPITMHFDQSFFVTDTKYPSKLGQNGLKLAKEHDALELFTLLNNQAPTGVPLEIRRQDEESDTEAEYDNNARAKMDPSDGYFLHKKLHQDDPAFNQNQIQLDLLKKAYVQQHYHDHLSDVTVPAPPMTISESPAEQAPPMRLLSGYLPSSHRTLQHRIYAPHDQIPRLSVEQAKNTILFDRDDETHRIIIQDSLLTVQYLATIGLGRTLGSLATIYPWEKPCAVFDEKKNIIVAPHPQAHKVLLVEHSLVRIFYHFINTLHTILFKPVTVLASPAIDDHLSQLDTVPTSGWLHDPISGQYHYLTEKFTKEVIEGSGLTKEHTIDQSTHEGKVTNYQNVSPSTSLIQSAPASSKILSISRIEDVAKLFPRGVSRECECVLFFSFPFYQKQVYHPHILPFTQDIIAFYNPTEENPTRSTKYYYELTKRCRLPYPIQLSRALYVVYLDVVLSLLQGFASTCFSTSHRRHENHRTVMTSYLYIHHTAASSQTRDDLEGIIIQQRNEEEKSNPLADAPINNSSFYHQFMSIMAKRNRKAKLNTAMMGYDEYDDHYTNLTLAAIGQNPGYQRKINHAFQPEGSTGFNANNLMMLNSLDVMATYTPNSPSVNNSSVDSTNSDNNLNDQSALLIPTPLSPNLSLYSTPQATPKARPIPLAKEFSSMFIQHCVELFIDLLLQPQCFEILKTIDFSYNITNYSTAAGNAFFQKKVLAASPMFGNRTRVYNRWEDVKERSAEFNSALLTHQDDSNTQMDIQQSINTSQFPLPIQAFKERLEQSYREPFNTHLKTPQNCEMLWNKFIQKYHLEYLPTIDPSTLVGLKNDDGTTGDTANFNYLLGLNSTSSNTNKSSFGFGHTSFISAILSSPSAPKPVPYSPDNLSIPLHSSLDRFIRRFFQNEQSLIELRLNSMGRHYGDVVHDDKVDPSSDSAKIENYVALHSLTPSNPDHYNPFKSKQIFPPSHNSMLPTPPHPHLPFYYQLTEQEKQGLGSLFKPGGYYPALLQTPTAPFLDSMGDDNQKSVINEILSGPIPHHLNLGGLNDVLSGSAANGFEEKKNIAKKLSQLSRISASTSTPTTTITTTSTTQLSHNSLSPYENYELFAYEDVAGGNPSHEVMLKNRESIETMKKNDTNRKVYKNNVLRTQWAHEMDVNCIKVETIDDNITDTSMIEVSQCEPKVIDIQTKVKQHKTTIITNSTPIIPSAAITIAPPTSTISPDDASPYLSILRNRTLNLQGMAHPYSQIEAIAQNPHEATNLHENYVFIDFATLPETILENVNAYPLSTDIKPPAAVHKAMLKVEAELKAKIQIEELGPGVDGQMTESELSATPIKQDPKQENDLEGEVKSLELMAQLVKVNSPEASRTVHPQEALKPSINLQDLVSSYRESLFKLQGDAGPSDSTTNGKKVIEISSRPNTQDVLQSSQFHLHKLLQPYGRDANPITTRPDGTTLLLSNNMNISSPSDIFNVVQKCEENRLMVYPIEMTSIYQLGQFASNGWKNSDTVDDDSATNGLKDQNDGATFKLNPHLYSTSFSAPVVWKDFGGICVPPDEEMVLDEEAEVEKIKLIINEKVRLSLLEKLRMKKEKKEKKEAVPVETMDDKDKDEIISETTKVMGDDDEEMKEAEVTTTTTTITTTTATTTTPIDMTTTSTALSTIPLQFDLPPTPIFSDHVMGLVKNDPRPKLLSSSSLSNPLTRNQTINDSDTTTSTKPQIATHLGEYTPYDTAISSSDYAHCDGYYRKIIENGQLTPFEVKYVQQIVRLVEQPITPDIHLE